MPTFKNHVKAKHSKAHAGRLFTYVDSKYTAAICPQSQVNKSRAQVQTYNIWATLLTHLLCLKQVDIIKVRTMTRSTSNLIPSKNM